MHDHELARIKALGQHVGQIDIAPLPHLGRLKLLFRRRLLGIELQAERGHEVMLCHRAEEQLRVVGLRGYETSGGGSTAQAPALSLGLQLLHAKEHGSNARCNLGQPLPLYA
jgi:hypothetical protein